MKTKRKVTDRFKGCWSGPDLVSTVYTNKEYGWVSVDDVEFIDISEDFQGYDMMTFKFKNETFQSRIVKNMT